MISEANAGKLIPKAMRNIVPSGWLASKANNSFMLHFSIAHPTLIAVGEVR